MKRGTFTWALTTSKPVALAVLMLFVGIATPLVLMDRSSAATPPSGGPGPFPASLTPATAWDGVDYNQTCSGCLPADAQIASNSEYVFEMVNGSYAVWTITGTLLTSNTLDTLFSAGSDPLTDPQVRYDTTTLRWFASADDLHNDQVLYGASETSDPTGVWNIQHFNPPGGDIPERSSLAVNALNLVETTNLFSRSNGLFLGSQVWVANKTQLLSGGGVSTWNSAVTPTEEALVPAQPLTSSKSMYLVSDGTGGVTSFDLYSLTGSPPATPILSSPVTFAISTTPPPNATQAGSADLVGVEDGRVQSAVWRAGTLWAAATDGCKPSGDAVLRSCLHLWEIATAGSTMEQNFVWSSGAGTYDFYPALSTNASGDLTVVFGESSSDLDPSVLVTGQTSADPTGTLEPPVLLKQGTGPYAPGSGCSGGVCPFGEYFGAAFEPLSVDRFWVVGEYTGSDSSTNYWRTWVASVVNIATYSVTFSESGLGAGSSWSVTLNGNTETSNASTIAFLEPNGSYTFSLVTPIAGGLGTRFVAASAGGSFAVAGANVVELINFTKQYQLTTSVLPLGAGTVVPAQGWLNASSSVSLGALANSSHEFRSWAGSGLGSYNGTSDPAEVVMGGPISEQATFVNSTTYPVTFTANGLPSGASWTASLNGLEEVSEAASMTFNVTNGSYTYLVPSPIAGGPGTQYVGTPVGGSFSVVGSNVSVPVAFTTEYRLSVGLLPVGSGSVSPASGWFVAHSVVNVTALPASGYAFAAWTGSGTGNYTGENDPAVVTMGNPIVETANFEAISIPTFRVTFEVSPVASGLIIFEGQNYSNNQSVTVPAGSYSLSQVALSGWDFVRWAAGGGVSIGLGETNVTGAGWINSTYVAVDRVSVVTNPRSCGSVSVAGNVYADGASIALVQGSYGVTASACGNFSLVSLIGLGGVRVSGHQLMVSGNGTVMATFAPGSSTGTPASGITAPVPLWALLVALGLLAAVFVLFFFSRRRKPPRGQVPREAVAVPPSVTVGPPSSIAPPESPPVWSEDSETPPVEPTEPPA